MASITGDSETDVFSQLLLALNPFNDNLLWTPQFHLFMNLPIELRYNVHEYYFESDTKSLSCANWTNNSGRRYRCKEKPGRRKSTPFLPLLFLTNRAIRAEAITPFLRVIHYNVFGSPDIRCFLDKMDKCRSISLAQNVLKLTPSPNAGEPREDVADVAKHAD
jgi:hypothetical protein